MVIKNQNNDSFPISDDYAMDGVYLKTLNGEWIKYDYKDVRGVANPESQYKVYFGEREFQLLDGLKYPYCEWKKEIYQDIFESQDLALLDMARLRQMDHRELTKALKHNWLYFVEVDKKSVEVNANKRFIINHLESQMQNLYLNRKFWKRWYDRHLHNIGPKIPIKLAVYDLVLDVTIDKARIEEYYRAAKTVTDKLNAFTVAFKGRKTEHQIALMTMIDLALP